MTFQLGNLACILVSLATVLTNSLVLAAVLARPALTRTRSNLYIVSLAVWDLVVGLLVMPLNIDFVLHEFVWQRGETLCAIWLLTDTLMCTASVWNVTAIAVDRLMAISRPIVYMKMTRKATLSAIFTFSLISLLICIPPLLLRDTIHLELCVYTSDTWFLVYSVLGAFVVPLLLIVVCYTFIFIKLYSKVKQRGQSSVMTDLGTSSRLRATSSGGSRSESLQHSVSVPRVSSASVRERRVLLQMSVLVLVFLMCWTPFWTLFITLPICLHYEWCTFSESTRSLGLTFQWLGYLNSLLNPFLYTMLNREFRAATFHVVRKILAIR